MGNEARREPRAHDAEILGPVPNRVVGIWRIEAARNRLMSSVELVERYPGIRLTSLDEIRSGPGMESLAECYRRVFGADETTSSGELIWGEGAHCGDCGRLIPLPEFERAAAAAEPVCPFCGEGLLVEIFPPDVLVASLEDLLIPRGGWAPVIAVLDSLDGGIGGFMYGAVTELGAALDRLHVEQSVYLDAPTHAFLEDIYSTEELPDGKLLYIEALGVELGSRDSIRTCQGLVGQTYTRAAELGATWAIAWTNPRSPAYALMLGHGFEEVARQGDRVYMLLPDVASIAIVLQHATADGTADVVRRSLEALAEDGIFIT